MAQQPAGLHSLPLEVLERIVDHIVDPELWKHGKVDWNWKRNTRIESNPQIISRQTIRNLRFVNRKLSDAASHAMVPILRIYLNESSLVRAEMIARCPKIAVGVRAVELVLDYCPDNMANDFILFAMFSLETLRQRIRVCNSYLSLKRSEEDCRQRTKKSVGDEEQRRQEYEESVRDCTQAIEIGKVMEAAWEGEPSEEPEPDSQYEHERDILRRAYRQFLVRHEEQSRLVKRGIFATKLSALIAKFPRMEAISFKDRVHDLTDANIFNDSIDLLNNPDKIVISLSEPQFWWAHVGNGPHTVIFATVTASALLWDVPIALYRAGVRLLGIHLECFPGIWIAVLETPRAGFLNGTDEEFRSSVAALQMLHFAPYSEPSLGFTGINDNRERQAVNYFKLCASSKAIRTLRVSLAMFDEHDLERNNPGNVLNNIATDHLEIFCTNCISTTFVEMKDILGKLKGRVKVCMLYNTYLEDGSWADIMDLLQMKIGRRLAAGTCRFETHCLSSREMFKFVRDRDPEFMLSAFNLRRSWNALKTHGEIRAYVAGETDENPFAQYKPRVEEVEAGLSVS